MSKQNLVTNLPEFQQDFIYSSKQCNKQLKGTWRVFLFSDFGLNGSLPKETTNTTTGDSTVAVGATGDSAVAVDGAVPRDIYGTIALHGGTADSALPENIDDTIAVQE